VRVVVIGTGPAGITAAQTVRALDPGGSVVALCAEPYPPYSPPAMADHFLTGRTATLYWKGPDVAERLGIDEWRDVLVAGVDTDERAVVLDSGEQIGYDRLIIASGSRLYAPVAGAELPGVYDFKSLRRATALIDRVRSGEAASALIVGAGLIGIELSLLLSELGTETTIVEREAWVMPRVLDEVTASVVEKAVVARGVLLRENVEVVAFEGVDSVSGVRLGSGEVLTADLYIAATGVKPHTEFLSGSAIASGWGVHVDDRLRTSVPGVYAAGDVAEVADWLTGERYVHAIFPNAVAQGRVAGRNALGAHTAYEGAEAMNSLKHLGVPVIAMGTTRDPYEVLRAVDGRGVRSVYVRDGRIIGAQLAGDTRLAGLYRSLMLRRYNVERLGEQLVDASLSVAEMVWQARRPGIASRRSAAVGRLSSSA
jgi:nitrite reductase (NADH) large subunit